MIGGDNFAALALLIIGNILKGLCIVSYSHGTRKITENDFSRIDVAGAH